MSLTQEWQDFPYNPISQFYRRKFGEKVYKIPVTTAETCPNRQGLRGMKTCNFCDVYGSAAYPELQVMGLEEQILNAKSRILKRVNTNKFLVYFQAYTTTYERVGKLREQLEIASRQEDVVGFVIGTRPDCISDSLFDLWNEYTKKFFVAVEFGVQSYHDGQLDWMRRGHSGKKSVNAILRTKKNTDVDLGVHYILGCPNETDEQIQLTAELTNALPIDNVKLHNLHVLKNTPLADDFAKGEFTPLERDAYNARVIHFLQHLSPDIAVHRLAALASRSEDLVAPAWTSKKMESYQATLNALKDKSAYQAQYYNSKTQDPFELLERINQL